MDEDGFRLASSRVVIVGLGLMGASLALDLQGKCAGITGIGRADRSTDTLDYALSQHIVDQVAEFSPNPDCDLLILAAPVRTIIHQLEILQGSADTPGKKTVVLDLGSTKTEIVKAMEVLPGRFDPIGGHPMWGKEVAGIRHSEAGLYQDKTFILAPLDRTSPEALSLVQELVSVIGAKPLILSPEKQDELVARTSHLPYLLASALMRAVMAESDPLAWRVAASGFKDTTRLAASDVTMMLDILLTNRQPILSALDGFQKELDTLAAFLRDRDEDGLRELLTQSQQTRALLFRPENQE